MTNTQSNISIANTIVTESNVEGWVGANIFHVVEFADQFQRNREIKGDIAEIGIHHGRLFFIIASASRDDEKCFAVDLFDRQDLNIDHSGSGSREIFKRYLSDLFPNVKSKTKIIQSDSMSLTLSQAGSLLGKKGIRILSIDGGHTRHHAVNDLAVAQEILVGGGIVLLDDFFGPHWPGVTEGFFEYMRSFNRRLSPVIIFENKLIMTTFSEADDMRERASEYMKQVYGDTYSTKWKFTELCGFQVLSCS